MKLYYPDEILATRVHLIKGLPHVWAKREDENGLGCKKRKYASLIPYLKKGNFDRIAVIGGWDSNNMAAILPLLREQNLPFLAFFKESHTVSEEKMKKNRLFLHQFLQKEEVVTVSKDDWAEVNVFAENHLQKLGYKNSFVIPEGASHPCAIGGLKGLWRDILRNEAELETEFEHIFLDSGTGITAAVQVWENVMQPKPKQIHVVHIAGDENYFKSVVEALRPSPTLSPTWQNHYPTTARSFGAMNATFRKEMARIWEQYQILTDPIYTAKSFLAMEKWVQEQGGKDNTLWIHSGGI